jgi:hypothetical protein
MAMAEQQSPARTLVGEHVFEEEPAEDIVVIRLRGEITPEDAPLMGGPLRRFIRDGRSWVFLLVDLNEMTGIPPSARKPLGEGILDVPIAAVAAIGATFAQRVVATLADRMSNLLRGGRRYETRFFSAEDQARAWLARKRLEKAKLASGA